MKGLRVAGVDMHIGSQIVELDPFDNAFALLSDFVRELRADGHTISHVDLGGGLGIPYREDNDPPPDPAAYAAVADGRYPVRPRGVPEVKDKSWLDSVVGRQRDMDDAVEQGMKMLLDSSLNRGTGVAAVGGVAHVPGTVQ